VIVHPDYMRTRRRLDMYRGLLAHLADKDAMWHTVPAKVARWVRERTDTPEEIT